MDGFRRTGSAGDSAGDAGWGVFAWLGRARCRGLSRERADELFFADGRRPDTVAHARRFCAGCPVRLECAALGVAVRAEFGVYGGVPGYARKTLLAWLHEARPEVDLASLGEVDLFRLAAGWIEEDPSVLGRSIREASRRHNSAYHRRRHATRASVDTPPEAAEDARWVEVPSGSWQPTLF